MLKRLIEKTLSEMNARRLFVTHRCYLKMSYGFLVLQILLGIFALIPHSAFGGGSDSKLTIGPHDAQLADVRLHYVVAGHGPLVLVSSPGWGYGSLYLQRGLTPLQERFTLLYIDTRGSGGSTRPEDGRKMGTAVMADDIDRLRSYLQLDSIDLIGHSHRGRHRSRLRGTLSAAGEEGNSN